MIPKCDFEGGCEREAHNQIFSTADDVPKGVVAGWYCSKHYQHAFYAAIKAAEDRGFQNGLVAANKSVGDA